MCLSYGGAACWQNCTSSRVYLRVQWSSTVQSLGIANSHPSKLLYPCSTLLECSQILEVYEKSQKEQIYPIVQFWRQDLSFTFADWIKSIPYIFSFHIITSFSIIFLSQISFSNPFFYILVLLLVLLMLNVTRYSSGGIGTAVVGVDNLICNFVPFLLVMYQYGSNELFHS